MTKGTKYFFKILIIVLPTLALFSCATRPHSLIVANAGYINAHSLPSSFGNINKIRLQALREAATTLGARGALAWRSKHIDTALATEATYLNHIFDFNQLLLSHNVLPPILVQSDDNLTLDNSRTIRTANQTYKIEAPARFVTAPPTWRTYLWMSYKKPSVPSKALLPTTQAEAYVWDQYLKDGWKQGLQQANDIFSANISRLKRDFMGMVLYRRLLAQNMISSPQFSKSDLGITGNKNEIRINDEIRRITADSALNLNSKQWKPIITQ